MNLGLHSFSRVRERGWPAQKILSDSLDRPLPRPAPAPRRPFPESPPPRLRPLPPVPAPRRRGRRPPAGSRDAESLLPGPDPAPLQRPRPRPSETRSREPDQADAQGSLAEAADGRRPPPHRRVAVEEVADPRARRPGRRPQGHAGPL